MSDFWLFFTQGLYHVLDWRAYDHILFLIVLCAAYDISSWKRLLLLVTSFTIGHTASLFLSNYQIASVSAVWIEFFIPITIIITAIYTIFRSRSAHTDKRMGLLYISAIFFGIIHGFGFGRYFNQINDEGTLLPLLEFALGIEMAQLVVVFMVVILGYVMKRFLRFQQRDWVLLISAIVIGMTLPMLIENWPFGQ